MNGARGWWLMLAAFSVEDFALTAIGLSMVEHARELNPLPAAAFSHGILVAGFVKVVALVMVRYLAVELERSYPVAARRTLAAWCLVVLGVNVFSVIQLARAGVLS